MKDVTILLHPQIPMPLHGLNPRTILGRKWWDKRREETLASAKGKCMACGGRSKRLACHEAYKIDYKKGEARLVKVVALCPKCHDYIHMGRLMRLVEKGLISKKYAKKVREHGDTLTAGYSRPCPPSIVPPEWKDWYLLLNGKKYYSKYKSYDEWKKEYEAEDTDLSGIKKSMDKLLKRRKDERLRSSSQESLETSPERGNNGRAVLEAKELDSSRG